LDAAAFGCRRPAKSRSKAARALKLARRPPAKAAAERAPPQGGANGGKQDTGAPQGAVLKD